MQTIQFKVDENHISVVLNLLKSLNSLKLNVINDLLVVNNIDNERKDIGNLLEKEELKSFSNHTANLIEEWKDEDEDKIWI